MSRQMGSGRYQVSFTAGWDDVEDVRRGVESFAKVVVRDGGRCHAITMVAGELVENAIKHGAGDGRPVEVVVRVDGDDHSVEVINPRSHNGAMPSEDVGKVIEWIRSFAEPLEAYQRRILESARTGRTSGLGLVRIAHEGRCALDYSVDHKRDTMSIVARFIRG